MTKMFGRGLLLVVPVLWLGCTSVTDPSRLLTASGTVTKAGVPSAATVMLSAGNFSTSRTITDGTFTLTVGGGGVPSSACSSARIEARIYAEDGETVVDEEVRNLLDCGEHTVDFEFP
jgi:hypothetical protein